MVYLKFSLSVGSTLSLKIGFSHILDEFCAIEENFLIKHMIFLKNDIFKILNTSLHGFVKLFYCHNKIQRETLLTFEAFIFFTYFFKLIK